MWKVCCRLLCRNLEVAFRRALGDVCREPCQKPNLRIVRITPSKRQQTAAATNELRQQRKSKIGNIDQSGAHHGPEEAVEAC
jgi:hypothetical protein